MSLHSIRTPVAPVPIVFTNGFAYSWKELTHSLTHSLSKLLHASQIGKVIKTCTDREKENEWKLKVLLTIIIKMRSLYERFLPPYLRLPFVLSLCKWMVVKIVVRVWETRGKVCFALLMPHWEVEDGRRQKNLIMAHASPLFLSLLQLLRRWAKSDVHLHPL